MSASVTSLSQTGSDPEDAVSGRKVTWQDVVLQVRMPKTLLFCYVLTEKVTHFTT